MFLMGQPGKDYLSIELKDGKVLAQYDLGSGSATLLSSMTYNDGKWHALYMNRLNNDGILKIDGSSGFKTVLCIACSFSSCCCFSDSLSSCVHLFCNFLTSFQVYLLVCLLFMLSWILW